MPSDPGAWGSGGHAQSWNNILFTADMKLADLTKEIEALKSLRHERLIRLHAICSLGDPVYIVTELMGKGNLQVYLGSE